MNMTLARSSPTNAGDPRMDRNPYLPTLPGFDPDAPWPQLDVPREDRPALGKGAHYWLPATGASLDPALRISTLTPRRTQTQTAGGVMVYSAELGMRQNPTRSQPPAATMQSIPYGAEKPQFPVGAKPAVVVTPQMPFKPMLVVPIPPSPPPRPMPMQVRPPHPPAAPLPAPYPRAVGRPRREAGGWWSRVWILIPLIAILESLSFVPMTIHSVVIVGIVVVAVIILARITRRRRRRPYPWPVRTARPYPWPVRTAWRYRRP